MAEDNNKKTSFGEDFRAMKEQWVKGMTLQNDFIKKEIKRIKDGLQLIPQNNLQARYNYLVDEKRNNLKTKAEFEFSKMLENDNNIYILPGACKEIDRRLAELIKKYEEYMELAKKSTSQTNIYVPPVKLSDLFLFPKNYQYIVNLLVEKGYCHSQTNFWIDDKKGNKELMVAIIKQLHVLRYYADDKKPTTTQIQSIAKNTFGVDVSIDTIKRVSHTHFNLSFLPPADKL